MTLDESSKLSPEQLRVAVAERLGYQWYWCWWDRGQKKAMLHFPPEEGLEFLGTKGTVSQTVRMTHEEIEEAKATGNFTHYLPNYPESRDACQSFEDTLTDEQWDTYCALLGGSLRSCGSARALERCRAFLAVSGNEL